MKDILANMDRALKQLDTHLIGTVAAINVSAGGVPKGRVNGARVSRLGLVNDTQNDTKHHGGPERAVCLYSLDRIVALQAEGHPIDAGTAGENVTVEGIDWNAVIPGVRVKVGEDVLLEVASFTVPCKTIKGSFTNGKFVRISQKLHPGWSRVYARVLSEGEIRSGDTFEVIPAPE
jgi:MOSC domain-containing protein YiiM